MEVPSGLRRFLSLVALVVLCFAAADLTAATLDRRLQVPPRPIAMEAEAPPPNEGALPASPRGLVDVLESTAPEPGEAPLEGVEGEVPVGEAPPVDTSLSSLSLKGTLAGQGISLAMIENAGETVMVGVGETIGGYTLVRVDEYSADLRKGAAVHTLEMNIANATGNTAAAGPASVAVAPVQPQVVPQETPPTKGSLSMDELQGIIDNPGQVAGTMRLTTIQRNGEVYGMMTQFKTADHPLVRLGLQHGDIVTAVNGRPLKGPEDLAEIYRIIRNTPNLRFTVERRGKVIPITAELVQ